ncbi:SAC3 domain-containing protein 1 isoform X3 [Dermacentor andersoni]|uniref:SAC3 domain-containing protein 1 isoform X3 n=1 Tax=Dermacentor andersoni TaxID=34620 RepID=UPI0024176632|nr:SAC3 domain-containing protein 1-like isoform X3 [Dermacentor andersoni]
MRARRGRGRAGDRYDRRQTGRGDTIDAPRQTTVIGTCQDMCPPRERQWREKERLLHPFEIAEGTESDVRPKADRNKAIKQFSRSAAGQREATPDELRPPQVLLMTTAYLMRVIAPSCSGDSWADTYHFVWDRLWAVRQDMTIQDLNGGDCIEILEQAVRFYVYSAFRNHSLVKISLDTSLAHRKGNFIRVLKNYRTLPSLLACALHSHLELIRRTALQVMTVAFSSKNCKFPLSVLGHWLSCSDHTARELCRLYQLPVQDSEVNFLKGRGDFTLKQLKKHHDSALMKVLSATDIGTLLCPDDKRQPSQLR